MESKRQTYPVREIMANMLKVKVSKYMSYLLRHNPENLKMDRYGFVDLETFYETLKDKFKIDSLFIFEIVEKSDRRRFEVVENKIRALYGHTVPVRVELEEDNFAKLFYHGTTACAASKILKEGLKPMNRRWVHLSSTMDVALEVGLRRTQRPVVFKINAIAARKDGSIFYKATNKVYVCDSIIPKYLKRVACSD